MTFSSNGGNGSIAAAADVALNNPSAGQVLSYDSVSQKWKNSSVTGGVSPLKAQEDASFSIYALAPSTESGLTAIAADTSNTDDSSRIQAMLTYIKNTYGGGRLLLPYGRTSRMNAGVTIPAGVQVVGGNASRWDFFYASSSSTAVTVNDQNCMPIVSLSITGGQYGSNTSSPNVTTSTGLQITGNGLTFFEVSVGGFHTGIDLTNDNTFIVSFDQSSVLNCIVGINLDIANAWTGASGPVNNSGERITFTNCVIANSGTVYWATGDGVGLFFVNTSMDFVTIWGRQQNAHVFFDSCHLESTYNGTTNYMFDLSGNPRLNFNNTNFILGSAGIYYLLNTAAGPYNYGVGMVHVKNCDVSFTMTSNANSAGAINSGFSESMVSVTQGSTSVIVASIFVSKWGAIKVVPAATDGGTSPNLTAYISAMSIPNGTVTISLSSPAPAGTFIEVSF